MRRSDRRKTMCGNRDSGIARSAGFKGSASKTSSGQTLAAEADENGSTKRRGVLIAATIGYFFGRVVRR
jgi:hypothetical protein